MNKIQQVESYVKTIIKNKPAHDFNHADRVRKIALKIAKSEDFLNLKIVEIAALMHDIGLSEAKNRRQHGEIGAEMAFKFLSINKIASSEEIKEICNAIKYHCKNREGLGQLLNIIRDADMIDLFGAVGIMRSLVSVSFKTEYDKLNIKGKTWQMGAKGFDKRFDKGLGIGETMPDQLNFQISCFDNLQTNFAKKLSKKRVKYMQNFIIELEKEVNNL